MLIKKKYRLNERTSFRNESKDEIKRKSERGKGSYVRVNLYTKHPGGKSSD